jgi:polar amino acid transport system substrate-binding protein
VPFLRAFIEEMKASGFVARELQASGQGEAAVAPPAA